MSEKVDWSELLPDIVCKIAGELHFYEDFSSFVDVCGSWRSSVEEDRSFPRPHCSRYPCLMLSKSKPEEEEYNRRFLFLSDGGAGGTIHKVHLPRDRRLQEHHYLSTHGWLLRMEEYDPLWADLIHPLSGNGIGLPRLYKYRGYELDICFMKKDLMRKVLISTSDPPWDSDYFVVVFWGPTMGIWRSEDDSWTYCDYIKYGQPSDMVYHSSRKELYLTTSSGTVFQCDIPTFCEKNDGSPHFGCGGFRSGRGCFHVVTDLPGMWWSSECYLLEWDYDSLLLVKRDYDGPDKIKRFQAFEFCLRDKKWTKMESLGDRSIFLGFNSSFAINASSNGNGCRGVKPNCIYFTDDSYINTRRENVVQDMGVYHMSNGSIEPLFDQQEKFISHLSPPIWLDTTK